eukprot:scaffold4388_cov94-Isochrysis_galbana.AAC.1
MEVADEAEPALFGYIRRSEIGASLPIQSPFGVRPVLYADHTASGRALSFIEDYVRETVLPSYGNTHTSTSKTGRQSSDFVAEARALVRHHTRCTKHDRLLFLGSGATAGALQLVSMLGLTPASAAALEAARALPEADRPVVFVGPYEHHSNLLPWRESVADVVVIREAPAAGGGGPDLEHLQAEMARHSHRPLRVGAFSAASNVTGALADVDAVTALCHQHNTLAVWDYASAASHGLPDMNPPARHGRAAASIAKDAAFFSMHKLAGGPQAPGVLVFKADAILGPKSQRRTRTIAPGGGTVFYVSESEHVYVHEDEERLQGGTPPVVGAIRAGLVLQLHAAVGAAAIAAADAAIVANLTARLSRVPGLILLGGTLPARVPTFALAVAAPAAKGGGRLLLHHNFAVALLNDLFGVQVSGNRPNDLAAQRQGGPRPRPTTFGGEGGGLGEGEAMLGSTWGTEPQPRSPALPVFYSSSPAPQARGGCMCAGPYSQRLLGIDAQTSSQLLAELRKKEDNELLRPGYFRVSLPYYASADELAFLGEALAFVAEHGFKLLSQYCPDPATAEWRHVHQRRPPRQWLGSIDYSSGEMRVRPTAGAPPLPPAQGLRGAREAALAEARAHVQVAESQLRRNGGTSGAAAILSPEAEALRWFLLPAEAAATLRGVPPAVRSPFWPPDAPQDAEEQAHACGGAAGGAGI